MKKILFLLLAATLFTASSAFAQVTFIGTFMDKKGAKINGLIAVLDIPGGRYNLIDPKGVAVKEQNYAFYFDPMKRTPTTQYLSADARIVVSSREAKPFKVDLPATTTTTSKTATSTFTPSAGTYYEAQTITILYLYGGTTFSTT